MFYVLIFKMAISCFYNVYYFCLCFDSNFTDFLSIDYFKGKSLNMHAISLCRLLVTKGGPLLLLVSPINILHTPNRHAELNSNVCVRWLRTTTTTTTLKFYIEQALDVPIHYLTCECQPTGRQVIWRRQTADKMKEKIKRRN